MGILEMTFHFFYVTYKRTCKNCSFYTTTPHDFLIAKLHAYGLSFETLTCLYLFLSERSKTKC